LIASLTSVRPVGGLLTCGSQYPIAELADQAGIFGDRDEFRRRDRAVSGMFPAQQRFAAGNGIGLQIHQWLVVDFEATFGKAAAGNDLPQILLELLASLHHRIPLGLEEAVGAAAVSLGGVHGQIGMLQQLVEISAVVWCQCDADAGVRADLVAQTIARQPHCVKYAVDERADRFAVGRAGLDDGEFVAAQPGNQIAVPDAVLQTGSHGLQQFVADRVPERIVHALEFIDVDVKYRALHIAVQFAPDLVVKKHPVGQAGESIVVREMRDPFLSAATLGDVLQRRNPSAVFKRSVGNLDRPSVTRLVGVLTWHSLLQKAPDLGAIRLDIAGKGAALLVMNQQFPKRAAGFDDVARQFEHVDIALIADDEPLVGIVEQKALWHIVDGHIETLLFQRDCSRDVRCCRDSRTTIRARVTAITIADRAAAKTINFVCARQSESADATVVVAGMVRGNRLKL
jgi:hypothetical protein